MKTIFDLIAAAEVLGKFIGSQQKAVMAEIMEGEEGQAMADIVMAYANRVDQMPVTYGQDGKGAEAIAYLHYFIGDCDWYVTEKDVDTDGEGQIQAFGYANLGDDQNAELGYLNLQEILEAGAELDLYFTPKTLGELKLPGLEWLDKKGK